MRKMVNIDTAALKALELLATDRQMSLQDLVEEAIADLLKKHRRPITTKEMFAQSLKSSRGKRKEA
jgi:Antitoxin-like ribbon-helix-helix